MHPLRLRTKHTRLQLLIAELPPSPEGSGRIFADVKREDEKGLLEIDNKIEECRNAGVLGSAYRYIKKGERLLVIVDPI